MLAFFARRICVAAGLCLLSSGPGMAHAPELHGFRMVNFEPPAAAPNFRFPNLEGQILEMEAFRGRFVLLNFWATWCPPCVKELPSLQGLENSLKTEGLSVVGISVDSPDDQPKVQQFIEDLDLTFAIPLDGAGTISRLYGTREFPSTFLIDPEGRIVAAAKGERDWSSQDALSYFREVISERR